jgi:hypothetical protein
VYDHPGVDLTPSTNPKSKPQSKSKPTKPKPQPLNPQKRTPVSPELQPAGAGNAAVAAHSLQLPSPSAHQSQFSVSHAATAGNSPTASGASTPSSVAYVSLESVLPRVNKALARRQASSLRPGASGANTPSEPPYVGANANANDVDGDDDPAHDVFLRWEGHLDPEKYAVLPNDWPYCVPYGVRHYCVWSRVSKRSVLETLLF